ncbi:MAG TPA: TIGR02117 family protein [Rhizobiaceae bacterium]|nr:TIGR02117 family protein [Rhizobiaceae bacterium]
MNQRLWRTLRRVLGAVVALCLIVIAGTVAPRAGVSFKVDTAGNSVRVLLLRSPIHTDIALPLDDTLRARFAFLREAGLPLDHPQARWLIVGWGARSFYTETPSLAQIRPGPLLRGVFGDDSVMHVVLAGDFDTAGTVSIDLYKEGYRRLLERLKGDFRVGDDGLPVLLAGKAYGENDAFFEANGRFHALQGCNIWMASVLREAGLATGWWPVTPHGLMWSVATLNENARWN